MRQTWQSLVKDRTGIFFILVSPLLVNCSWKLFVVVECCSGLLRGAGREQSRLSCPWSCWQEQGQGLQPPRYNSKTSWGCSAAVPGGSQGSTTPISSSELSVGLHLGTWSHKLLIFLIKINSDYPMPLKTNLTCVWALYNGENTLLFTPVVSLLLW